MLFLAASKGNCFQWTPEHNVVMRSFEKGQINIGEQFAAALNSPQQLKFRVTATACKESTVR